MQYKNNLAFAPLLTGDTSSITFYGCADITRLALDRKIALDAQSIFADGVISLPLLKALAQSAIKDLDEKKSLVNQGVYWNNILYRCSYPVDEDVALRAAACVTFIEGEDPDKCLPEDIARKVQLFKQDEAVYAFFLTMGLKLVPQYKAFAMENFQSYFKNRRQTLAALTPQP